MADIHCVRCRLSLKSAILWTLIFLTASQFLQTNTVKVL
jgi:hypothetical protein